jgi:crotonobetainyl-CoA:carnitine CoA-transferase CaiB-like acyl-CoA transferase
VMGPYATQILGEYGADVIKVEPPQGDSTRFIRPARNIGMGAMFLHTNRNKRSIVLDLKHKLGRKAVLALVKRADVLVHNIRPAAMARLGLGYADLAADNPRLIYVAAVGYGQRGRYAAKPAYDDLIQGATGMPALIARASGGDPQYVPTLIADRTVGLHVANAISAALYARERTGKGQAIEVPMFESFAQFLLGDHMAGLTFDPPIGDAGYARVLTPHRRPFATKDGHICVLVHTDKQWRSFLGAVGREDLLDDARFKDLNSRGVHVHEVYGFVADVMRTRTTADWLAALERADLPAMALQTVQSLIDDPHLGDVGFFRTIDHPSEGRVRVMNPPSTWSGTPPEITRPAPGFGEHSREVLREAGFGADEIERMLAAGATRAD